MAARNIRSIEQLKNVHKREAGLVLGIRRLPSKLGLRKCLYAAARMKVAGPMALDFFRRQICAGVVSAWLWFTDGHLLPYTGKRRVHSAYNTQRRMPVPGRTNMVTTDAAGRIVDFEIQEGKGDLRNHLIKLGKKWRDEVAVKPVMVFDREGYGAKFFYEMNENGVGFVAWEKHIDAKKLKALEEDLFIGRFEFNGKTYRVFEGERVFTHTAEDKTTLEVTLRRIYIWNVTSNRKTCALSNEPADRLDVKECAMAILHRWGASENTFKHMGDRHPLEYQPGFEFVESEKQEIANPELKEKKSLLTRMKRELTKLCKKFTKSEEVYNKTGEVRKNSAHGRLKLEIRETETEVETLKSEIKEIPERIDVSKLDDYRCFEKVCDESKSLFDFVTSSVWNARKLMTEWLLPFYYNKNEYIDLFYAITNCHGWIKSEKTRITVRLEPLQQPSRRAAQEQFCKKLTELGAMTPGGKVFMVEVGDSPLA